MKKTLIGGLAGLLMTVSSEAAAPKVDVPKIYVGHVVKYEQLESGLDIYTERCYGGGSMKIFRVASDTAANNLLDMINEGDISIRLRQADAEKAIINIDEGQIMDYGACKGSCGCHHKKSDF